jgi:hypothetical protein
MIDNRNLLIVRERERERERGREREGFFFIICVQHVVLKVMFTNPQMLSPSVATNK